MEICLAILLQHKSLVHSYPELLGLSEWLLEPLWLCRINDTAGWDELNWSKRYCHQKQAAVTHSPKCWGFLLSGEEKIMTRALMQENIQSLTVSCRLAVESLQTCSKMPTCVFSLVPGVGAWLLVSRAVAVKMSIHLGEDGSGSLVQWGLALTKINQL